MPVDAELFEAIQSLTGIGIVDQSMMFLAEYLVVLVPLALVYLWFQGREGKHDSILTFGATVTGIIAAYALGLLYSHQNPSVTYETLVSANAAENAFPSQHTATVFATAWPLLWKGRKKIGYLMIVAAVLTGFSRVYIGEHWPVDILGAVIASLAGLGFVYLGEDHVELLDPVYKVSEKIEESIFG